MVDMEDSTIMLKPLTGSPLHVPGEMVTSQKVMGLFRAVGVLFFYEQHSL